MADLAGAGARLAFVDVADLEAAAAGTKEPRSVSASCLYDLMADFGRPEGTVRDPDHSHDVLGVAYDERSRRLCVGQSMGNDLLGHPFATWPVIHVYQVSGAATGSTPQRPNGLAVR